MTALLRYPGAKWAIAHRIVTALPAHYHYVEPYFGSGAVFFTKPPSSHELINDLDGRVVNLWRVLRERPDELCWAIETTPWARAEYDASDDPADEPVEAARRFVVRCWQAHAADLAKKTGWRSRGAQQPARGMSDRWARLPEQLRSVAERLASAEIEHRPAVQVIRRHAHPSCLIYADPPYLPATRTQTVYREEMTASAHEELLDALCSHPGPVVLSGYADEGYDRALVGWQRLELAAPKTHGAARTELLWIKDVTR